MASFTLKALLVAFATLSSAAPATDDALAARANTLPGGADCCTWAGCAKCDWGACVLNKSTAEGVCPYKSGTLAAPIPSGEKCCKGAGCQSCVLGECLVTAVFSNDGYCPWSNTGSNPGRTCHRRDKCRFGVCLLLPRRAVGICPTEGLTKEPLGQGEKCCLEASCAPCALPYYCQTLARPNAHNFPAGTCQFN